MSIDERVAEEMSKPKILIIEKGDEPSTYKVFTMYKGSISRMKFSLGLIAKIGYPADRKWLCLDSYATPSSLLGNYGKWFGTLRECKAYFQTLIDIENKEA